MPVVSFIPDIIKGAASLGGALIGASATDKAAELQKQSSDQALAYAKQQDAYKTATEANRYASMVGGLKPYASSGSAAAARQAQLLGLPAPETGPTYAAPPTYPTPPPPGLVNPTNAPPGTAIPRTPPQVPNPGPSPFPAGGGAPAGAGGPGGGTVMMRSPDGKSTQAVPAEAVGHYQGLGATVVQ